MKHTVFDDHKCQLGEGPFWHPERQELLWFDILDRKLLSSSNDWTLPRAASAAGWIDSDSLLIATSSGLEVFNLRDGSSELIQAVEADNTVTRSNDGRTDPLGGFWFSTMGWNAEAKAGAIYRYAEGEVRKLHEGVTIPNAICFSPCSNWAYFADTSLQQVFRQKLDPATGWPVENATLFVDFSRQGKNPDGAITDIKGNVWIAMWGSSELLGVSPEGDEIGSIPLPTPHVTCPASGSLDTPDIYITSALFGLPNKFEHSENPAGKTFLIRDAFQSQPSVPVKLQQPTAELRK